MTWYLAQLLFAQAPDDLQAAVLCESSFVLFEATSARQAYDKAIDWGHHHEAESTFTLLGVQHLNSLDQPPGDGVEVGGEFFEESAVWMRRDELIPARDEIPVIVFEQNSDTPIEELIDGDTEAKLRKLFSTNAGSDGPTN